MDDEEGRLLSEDEIGALLASLGDDEEPAEEPEPEPEPVPEPVAEAPPAPPEQVAAPAAPAPVAAAPPEAPKPQLPPLEAGVKLYDFRRPERLSKDHLNTLGTLHGHFAQSLSSTLSGLLRTRVELEVKGADQSSYGAYVERATEGHLFHILALNPLPGAAALEVSGPAAFAMLERVLGGSGRSTALKRTMTEIEAGLFKSMLTPYFLASLREAWVSTHEIDPVLAGDVATSASLLQIALASDAVAVIEASGHVADVEATVRICLPHGTLEPVMPKLGAELLFRPEREADDDEAKRVRERLATIKLPVAAELGGTDVMVDELLGLQVGDVIRLDSLADREILVLVNGRGKYSARPGLVGSRVAMRVAQVVTDDSLEEMGSDGTD